jgi:hypothetical protein
VIIVVEAGDGAEKVTRYSQKKREFSASTATTVPDDVAECERDE